jgi:hypothetical protein
LPIFLTKKINLARRLRTFGIAYARLTYSLSQRDQQDNVIWLAKGTQLDTSRLYGSSLYDLTEEKRYGLPRSPVHRLNPIELNGPIADPEMTYKRRRCESIESLERQIERIGLREEVD